MKPHQYAVFREKALSVSREEVGISQPATDAPVWGIVMEIATTQGLVAALALADGTASVYSSNGRAVIGGHSYECVRRAASEFLVFANGVRACMMPAREHPSPVVGTVAFYMRTDAGLIAARCGEAELRCFEHPLSGLYMTGHALIAELRKVCEAFRGRDSDGGRQAT